MINSNPNEALWEVFGLHFDCFGAHWYAQPMRRASQTAQTVAQALRGQIERRELVEGSALPTERALSEGLGVSRQAVRKAVALLAEEGLVESKPNCRPVVLRGAVAAHEAGRNVVALWLWPHREEYMASLMLRGIRRTLEETALRITLPSVRDDSWQGVLDAEERFLLKCAEDPQIAGLILLYVGGERNLEALRAVRSRDIPIVFLDRQAPAGFEADFVGTHNAASARRAVEHLLALGHKHVACVSNGSQSSSVLERESGYRRAMLASGLDVPPEARFTLDRVTGQSWEVAADRVLDELLASYPQATAVFAINDLTALLIREAMEGRGLRVPEDLSIVGFDGLLSWTPGGGPITTVIQDFARMGEMGAEILLDRMDQGPAQTYRHVLLEAPLLINGSTGPPRRPDLLLSSNITRRN
jgi:DNA-binding LacI/PurR family transcriptional regulator